MVKRTVVGGVMAGLVAFVWGGLSWSVLPFQTGKIRSMPDETAVAEFLAKTLPGPGVYQYPGDPDPATGDAGMQEAMRRYARGPVVPLLVFMPGPGSMDLAGSIGSGLSANIFAGLLLSAILAMASPARYWRRVGLVALIATFGVVISHVPYWVWGAFPGTYTLIVSIDAVIGWLLAGAVLARIVGPTIPKRQPALAAA